MSAPDGPVPLYLRRDGVGLVVDGAIRGEPGLPRVLHWGSDLGPLAPDDLTALRLLGTPAVPRNALDEPWPLTLVPTQGDGWLGRPGFAAHRGGAVVYPRWTVTEVRVSDDGTDPHGVTIVAADPGTGVELTSAVRIASGGLVGVTHTVRNTGADDLDVVAVTAMLPVPDVATEVVDLAGRWSRERVPQRAPWRFGSWVRESRRGRTGHDAPGVMAVAAPGPANRRGTAWGVHVAWSGNHVHLAERLPEGAGPAAGVVGGGEVLEPGEMVLASGTSYRTPTVWFVHTDAGFDGIADRFHRYLRSRPGHPATPRPVVLNTWEAVYLDHDEDRLLDLATRAADVGVERFVLDDGWFHGRPGTVRRGLGDWWVDPSAWPRGLGRLAGHVRSLGMDFGLWVEPEMVSPDSELARRHPSWLLAAPDRRPRTFRHQHVLDLARPQVREYLFEALSALVHEYSIAFLKWDHNRDVHEPVHEGIGGVHRQTAALYELLDRIRAAHPSLEIESCASGGARIDLGILDHADRVWVSDTNDPLERQRIQRWTRLFVPVELQGAHVGPSRAHTTGRTSSVAFRAVTALLGHPGIEWDLATCTPDELAVLRRWTSLYRELRPVLHSGTAVHPDDIGDEVMVTGIVATDRSSAVYVYARLDTSVAAGGERIRFDGLDDGTAYRVRVRRDLGEPETVQAAPPAWWTAPDVVVRGTVLRTVGLPAPHLVPGAAVLLTLTAE